MQRYMSGLLTRNTHVLIKARHFAFLSAEAEICTVNSDYFCRESIFGTVYPDIFYIIFGTVYPDIFYIILNSFYTLSYDVLLVDNY